jgi:Caspase domain
MEKSVQKRLANRYVLVSLGHTEVATVMRRRDVLVGAAAWAQLVASRKVLAQPSTRAAVVVGVNKTGNLPVLQAAVSGAKSVADWLIAEGFEVTLIVDDNQQPVAADTIKRAVTALVDRGTLTQLVIYFSGHGVAFGTSEFWLLTGAPDDLNEAVNVVECVDKASRSAIANVVIICDACRSIPDFDTSLLHGTVIFPRGGFVPGAPPPDVDRFYGTRPGSPSYEVKLAADNYTGIYTSTFLDGFKRPRVGMVSNVNGVDVVSNRALKNYLLNEVPLRLRAAGVRLTQYPDSRVESDNAYLGRALAPAAAAPVVVPEVTIADIANHQFNLTEVGALGSLRGINPVALDRAATVSGFSAAQRSLLAAKNPASFEADTGFSIIGATVRAVWVAGAQNPEIVSAGDGYQRPALVRIPGTIAPMTAALVFEDGSGTVVAALPGFIGSLSVKDGVMGVTYSPSGNRFDGDADRLDKLRALVATSANFGVFRIDGDRESRTAAARRLADQIRVLKGVDPTLGIYAAYAYADAHLLEQVRSVQSIMANDLGADLFDVALLADRLTGRRIEDPIGSVVPFCPMLTQGWQLLRVREVSLSDDVQRARDNLRPALWTTFGPRGMEFIGRAIQSAKPTRLQ